MSGRTVVMSVDGFITGLDGAHGWTFAFFGEDPGAWNHRAPIAIGAGRSPSSGLEAPVALDLVAEERSAGGALGQVLVSRR